ncbi:MAG: DNA translocase FtsK 4TM domain-containing protein, partial [Lentisphaerae bacterium]|nr:DNA translocase FtsK 4TM domain-containing protein [Lentisphaerota bacterium]
MADKTQSSELGLRFMWGMILLALCLFTALSVFSYDWRDIGLLHVPPNSPPANLIGLVGAWLSFACFTAIGLGAYLVPLWCLVFGIILVIHSEARAGAKALWCTVLLLALTALFALQPEGWTAACRKLNIVDPGGVLGRLLVGGVLVPLLSPVGTGILVGVLMVFAAVMLVGAPALRTLYARTVETAGSLRETVRHYADERQDRRQQLDREERRLEKQRRKLERSLERRRAREQAPPAPAGGTPDRDSAAAPARRAPVQPAARAAAGPGRPARSAAKRPAPRPAAPGKGGEAAYTLPPLDVLVQPAAAPRRGPEPDTAVTANVLAETLAEFGIEAEVTHVERGPVVTRYEVLPAPGIRVERISGLSNNLALSLKATSVRVQAPIPGKGVVGIEVPNADANLVSLREVLEGSVWQSGDWKLPLVLGKDVGGKDLVADLTDMPHLLIAGATGSGKTVCMNSILAGLLMARTPDELRLLLVDPKIVEFSAYNHLPHLMVPVVTNPKKVSLALRWAINEMENRYKLFAKTGVRNIESYNQREIATQEELFGAEAPSGETAADAPPERLPYIVIVVDELADLMLADQADIENAIARLAQLSRAVGIHMILSTQRPSVNVITGTIKANFPARIAFQVAQRVDSRTILDTIGAEKLLGRG